ncbi:MAG: hypothetical protein IJV88_06445, partial [Ruminococcus sp.]|nr:hypothetical protein [Ruminococcus sp.]
MTKAKRILSILLVVLMLFSMSIVATSAYTVPDGYAVADKEGNDETGIDGEVYGLIGDTDMNDKVNVRDATLIQKYAALLENLNDMQKVLADVNFDGKTNVKDATAIQKWVAYMEVDAPINHLIYIPTATEPTPTQTEPAPTQTEPAPTQTEPAPTQTEPAPTQTEPAPTQTEPTPTQTAPVVKDVVITVVDKTTDGWLENGAADGSRALRLVDNATGTEYALTSTDGYNTF